MSIIVDFISDVASAVKEYVIEPILDDPLSFIATAAAASMGIPFLGIGAGGVAAGIANTAAGLVQGESFDEAVKGGVTAGLTTFAVNEVSSMLKGSPAPVDAGTSNLGNVAAGTVDDLGMAAANMGDEVAAATAKGNQFTNLLDPLDDSLSSVNKDILKSPTFGGGTLPSNGVGNTFTNAAQTMAGGLDDGLMNSNMLRNAIDQADNTFTNNVGKLGGNTSYGPAYDSLGQFVDDPFSNGMTPNIDPTLAKTPIYQPNAYTLPDSITGARDLLSSGKAAPIVDGYAPIKELSGLGGGHTIGEPIANAAAMSSNPGIFDYTKAITGIDVTSPYFYVPAGAAAYGYYGAQQKEEAEREKARLEAEAKAKYEQQNAGMNSQFQQRLAQLKLERQRLANAKNLKTYGQQSGGEHQFYSGSSYVPVQSTTGYAMGGGVQQPQQTQQMQQPQRQPNSAFGYYRYGNVPQSVRQMSMGGLNSLSKGRQPHSDGRSDDIPAVLSDGEYVIDAETVALLGNGSNDAGAKQLDMMRQQVRKQKGGALSQGKFSPNARSPLAYLKSRG
jgi:hypothetical protein